ncbi:uL14 family ribosomal protein, partial [Candidatus Poribacteria bacterium]|nr:uL14 family ribosomal protein [Candidatus Poribacteria bacterium]
MSAGLSGWALGRGDEETENVRRDIPMVQSYTRLNCADNTGAKQLMCIRVL